ncbi:MAG: DUF493 domain-containing protein [Nitrosomonadales bacterium]|jgi:hypothetical protein|nr:DUF493 domain-containing protein [Nitrosomonadales bacterium]MBT3917914.1 DUF493 domain-containing protein [Nitrosomonadales bacterium]MBT4183330.1 DUF493 domain-containing protein [Nitrosomonadales bacterium]MBT4571071.1 DUF493 domain-containing protein [Nitrosomonadales bacterium]MBT4759558.1 DUF493 domain-containing protein [Nitrosomonadales bacterium]
MDDPTKEPLIIFPCHFSIKVIGDAVENFSDIVLRSITKYDARFDSSCIDMKGSSTGKYISLTCKVFVLSQKQLDNIYIELSGLKVTKFVL